MRRTKSATHSPNSQNYKNKLKIENFFLLSCVCIESSYRANLDSLLPSYRPHNDEKTI
ncbi:hypothetical protein [Helicobacter fennelliae]|uniref:Uncharacterized protein n=1 Tax=Helicobacter fennelliae MRY12-0050 TaxID=1325130 RepID=T1CQ33_9HELI|nr:hypothetical protein [Helicobacter fennelliae]GAD18859.1 hypothetical protein HFN_2271 [Helicobacter fennelliae MRY12-0050]